METTATTIDRLLGKYQEIFKTYLRTSPFCYKKYSAIFLSRQTTKLDQ